MCNRYEPSSRDIAQSTLNGLALDFDLPEFEAFKPIGPRGRGLEHRETKWTTSRIHGAERRQVQVMFEEERPHLQSLPALPMAYFRDEQRTVCDDGCARVAHCSYAARPAAIGTKVLVRIFEHRLEIRDLQTQALLRTHMRLIQLSATPTNPFG